MKGSKEKSGLWSKFFLASLKVFGKGCMFLIGHQSQGKDSQNPTPCERIAASNFVIKLGTSDRGSKQNL